MEYLSGEALADAIVGEWDALAEAGLIEVMVEAGEPRTRRIRDILLLTMDDDARALWWSTPSVQGVRPADWIQQRMDGVLILDAWARDHFSAVAPRLLFGGAGQALDARECDVLSYLLVERMAGRRRQPLHNPWALHHVPINMGDTLLAGSILDAAERHDGTAVNAMLMLAMGDISPEIRAAGAKAARLTLGYASLRNHLAHLATDRDVTVRRAAVDTLAPRADLGGVQQCLFPFVDDPDTDIQTQAMDALAPCLREVETRAVAGADLSIAELRALVRALPQHEWTHVLATRLKQTANLSTALGELARVIPIRPEVPLDLWRAISDLLALKGTSASTESELLRLLTRGGEGAWQAAIALLQLPPPPDGRSVRAGIAELAGAMTDRLPVRLMQLIDLAERQDRCPDSRADALWAVFKAPGAAAAAADIMRIAQEPTTPAAVSRVARYILEEFSRNDLLTRLGVASGIAEEPASEG